MGSACGCHSTQGSCSYWASVIGDTCVLCMLPLAIFLCLFPLRHPGHCSSRVVPYLFPSSFKRKSSFFITMAFLLLLIAAASCVSSADILQRLPDPLPVTASPLSAVAAHCLLEVSRCPWKAACTSVQPSNWKELVAKCVWMGWPNSTANLRGMGWTCLVPVLFLVGLRM